MNMITRRILPLLFLVLFSISARAQCVIEALVLDSIIDCDQPAAILLSGFADGVLVEDFNIGGPGSGWSATSSAQYDNPCPPSTDGSPYLWMGPSAGVPRILSSNPFDMSGGARICFDLIFAEQVNSSPCEGPDEPDEGVALQYSTDGGATWENIYYFNPDTVCCGCPPGGCGGAAPSPFINWGRYCFDLPPGGWSTGTQIRWFQDNDSGAGFDHWGLDNIEILVADTNYTATNAVGDTVPIGDTIFVSPTADSTYNFQYTNGVDDTCFASGTVLVNPTDAGPDSTFACPGTGATLQATGALNVAWTPNIWIDDTTSLTPTVTPPRDTTYVVTSNCGTDSIDLVFVEIKDISNDTLICNAAGTCFDLFVEFYTDPSRTVSYTWTNTTFGGFAGITPLSDASLPTPTVCPPGASDYRVLITDGVCPDINDTVSIALSAPIIVTDTFLQPATCPADSNGQIAVTLSNGSPPYEYSIDGGATWQVGDSLFTGLVAGPYTVNFRDDLGCVGSVDVVLPGPLPFVVDSVNTVDVTCGGVNGEIEVFLSNASTPYSYFIDGAPNPTGSFTGLASGTYSIRFEDSNGCADSIDVVVDEIPPFFLDITRNDSTSCANTADGVLQVSVSSGAAPFDFRIDGGPWVTDSLFTGLTAGPHLIEVRDAAGCIGGIEDTVGAPPAIVITRTNLDSVLCAGGSEGRVDVSVSGGNPAYTYSLDGSPFGTDSFFTGLTAGVYDLVVEDVNLCRDTLGVSIFEPGPLSTSVLDSDSASCAGAADGSLEMTGSGGTSPYEFSLDGGPFQPTGLFTGLTAGVYEVVNRDDNGCTDTVSVTIDEPDTLQIFSITVDSVSCNGLADGSITVTATGGTPTYLFSAGGGFGPSNVIDTAAGLYDVVVQDQNGCTDTAAADVGEPDPILLSVVRIDSTSCFGVADGLIEVDAVQGTAPYDFSIGGGPFSADSVFTGVPGTVVQTITVQDANGCTNALDTIVPEPSDVVTTVDDVDSVLCFGGDEGRIEVSASGGTAPYDHSIDGVTFDPSNVFDSLTAGAYTVYTRDARGCLDSVAVTIVEPADLRIVSAVQDSVACHDGSDGSIQLSVAGGTPGYAFTIDGFGTTQPDSLFGGLAAGTYTVQVTDANGCGPDSAILDVFEPDTLEITALSVSDINCFGDTDGVIDVTATGGTTPYQYSLDGVSFQASSTFTGLAAGGYTVFVRDANGTSAGCLATADTAIVEPPQLVLTLLGSTDITCPGGSDGTIDVQATGGTPPYSFSSDGGSTFGPDSSFAGLPPSSYTVVVRDASGCEEQITVPLDDPDAFVLTPQTVQPSCAGFADGSITLDTLFGGTAPYTVSFDGASPVAFTDDLTFSGLAADPAGYTIDVEDALGCMTSTAVPLGEPTAIDITSIDTTRVSCFGDTDGAVDVTAAGGTPGYDFFLVNGLGDSLTSATGSFSDLPADSNYTALVVDANGCFDSEPVIITTPDQLSATAEGDSISCFGQADGTIDVFTEGGTSPYTFSLENGETGESPGDFTFFGLGAGPYVVTVTDANDCSITAGAEIGNQLPVIAEIEPDTISYRMGESGMVDEVIVRNARGDLSYTWTPSFGLDCADCENPTVSNFQSVVYELIVTDAFGCVNENEALLHVLVDGTLEYYVPNAFTPNADGMNDDFRVYGSAIKNVYLEVYDRWGQKLYQGDGIDSGWDGTFQGAIQAPGVYTYYVDITFLNDENVEQKGSLTLIR